MIWNHEAETMSREAHERLQLQRLGETIAWAVARVPFHRDRLSGVTVRGLPGLVTTEPCRCGRTSVRMAGVKGRSDDMLVIRGVNLYPSEVERTLLSVEELVPHYQLVVDRAAPLARLEVQVEPAAEIVARCGGFSAEHPEIATLRRRVADRLQQAIGLSVELTIVAPRTLPRSEGKAVRVIERGRVS